MLCSKGWGAIGSLKVEIGVTDLHFRKAGLEAEGHGNSMLGICLSCLYREEGIRLDAVLPVASQA